MPASKTIGSKFIAGCRDPIKATNNDEARMSNLERRTNDKANLCLVRHSSFAIRHSPFAIRHSPFAIRHSPFAIRHSSLQEIAPATMFLLRQGLWIED